MKTSTMVALGGVALVGYMIYKNNQVAYGYGYGGYSGQGSLPGAGGGYAYNQRTGMRMNGVVPNRGKNR